MKELEENYLQEMKEMNGGIKKETKRKKSFR